MPGATAGLVAEVLIADGGSQDDTAAVADVAGCSFMVVEGPLAGRLKAAASAARMPWLMFLRPGIVLDTPWTGEVGRFVQQDAGPGAGSRVSPRQPAKRICANSLRSIATLLGAPPRPEQGLLIAKDFYETSGGHSEAAGDPEHDLVRRIGRRHIVKLATQAFGGHHDRKLRLLSSELAEGLPQSVYAISDCRLQHRHADHRVEEDRIATVRRFNRFYTRQIGVLRKTFLDSPYSLGEARVLYEIACGDAPTASAVGRALDLDAGYLSRVLRNFEKRGLIRREASSSDARQSHLTLTPRGRKDYAPLERRSQHDTGAMLGQLKPENQLRLIAAMATIQTLLDGGAETTAPQAPAEDRGYILRAPRPGDFGWVVKRHAELYAQEYGGSNRSKASARKSSPTSPTRTIPSASAAGSRKWTARLSAAFSWPPIPTRSRASACCWSIRERADLGLARGWSTNASISRAAPATKRSRYGRTACSPRRGTFIRKPDLRSRAARSA